MDYSTAIAATALIFTIIGAVWTQGIWISKQFATLKDYFSTKLEYHERHDDTRFNKVDDNIWFLRLRLQGINGAQNYEDDYNFRSSRREATSGRSRSGGVYKTSSSQETPGEHSSRDNSVVDSTGR